MRELFRFTARTSSTLAPVPFGALIVRHANRQAADARLQCRMRRKRPFLARGIAHRAPGLQEAEEPHRLPDTRCTPRASRAPCAWPMRCGRGSTAWSSARQLQDASRYCLQIHIPARKKSRAARTWLHSGRPGAARAVQHAFHASEYAEGIPHLEHVEDEIGNHSRKPERSMDSTPCRRTRFASWR